MKYVLGFDIGTGSVKGGLYDSSGVALRVTASPYPTHYAAGGIAEQDPADWWSAFSRCLASLSLSTDERVGVVGIGLSGHSMSVAPLGSDGSPLTNRTPIWSDRRAGAQVEKFFSSVDRSEWYSATGNGQDPRMYSVSKLMWLRENLPDTYKKADKFVGTKDYINFRLTGRIATDPSYASGCGLYSLKAHDYIPEFLLAAGIDREKLPDILPSGAILGHLTAPAAAELGLSQDIAVVCGGVDNCCTALGAGCTAVGDSFASLGSSSQIALSSGTPDTDASRGLFTWEHCVAGQYIVNTGTLSSGSSFDWMLKNLFFDLDYASFDALAALSPLGAKGVMFCPALAGAAPIDPTDRLFGGFGGLTLASTRADIARSIPEGIAFELKLAYDAIFHADTRPDSLTLVGGGAKSELWRSIYADILGIKTTYTELSRNAATLGAAALAIVGTRLGNDYGFIKHIYDSDSLVTLPDSDRAKAYAAIFPKYLEFFKSQGKS